MYSYYVSYSTETNSTTCTFAINIASLFKASPIRETGSRVHRRYLSLSANANKHFDLAYRDNVAVIKFNSPDAKVIFNTVLI